VSNRGVHAYPQTLTGTASYAAGKNASGMVCATGVSFLYKGVSKNPHKLLRVNGLPHV